MVMISSSEAFRKNYTYLISVSIVRIISTDLPQSPMVIIQSCFSEQSRFFLFAEVLPRSFLFLSVPFARSLDLLLFFLSAFLSAAMFVAVSPLCFPRVALVRHCWRFRCNKPRSRENAILSRFCDVVCEDHGCQRCC